MLIRNFSYRLSELKKYTAEGSALAQMQEFTAARLSVSKVSEKEWNFIVDNLIDGYDDDGEAPIGVPVLPKINPPSIFGGAEIEEPTTNGLPYTFDALVRDTIESEAPTADTALANIESSTTIQPNGHATPSRPTSRAASRKTSSRAGSRTGSRPASRAGSLAPPKTEARGRSRTPRASSAQPAMIAVQEEMELSLA